MSKERNKYDVFISHSHKDYELAHKIAELLSEGGLRVFDPDTEIRIGDSISDVLEDALENSKYFILLISPDYISSKWTNFEMGVALGREPSATGRRIFPVITRDVDFRSIPIWLSNISAINAKDYSPEEIASKLKEAIKTTESPLIRDSV